MYNIDVYLYIIAVRISSLFLRNGEVMFTLYIVECEQ